MQVSLDEETEKIPLPVAVVNMQAQSWVFIPYGGKNLIMGEGAKSDVNGNAVHQGKSC